MVQTCFVVVAAFVVVVADEVDFDDEVVDEEEEESLPGAQSKGAAEVLMIDQAAADEVDSGA